MFLILLAGRRGTAGDGGGDPRRGHRELVDPGAKPVFDSCGTVRYAVCSLAFSSELDDTNVAAAGNAIRLCAEAITLRTGGTLPDGYPFPATPQN